MKKNHCLLFLLLAIANLAMAQVGVNTDNSDPDPASMLDIKSVNKGLLLPRMTDGEMTAILLPPEGLMVYNTTDSSLYWFDGGLWKKFNDHAFIESDPVFSTHPASQVTATGIFQWDSAFGWGDHSKAGYLKSFSESDPLFLGHVSSGISTNSIDNWNSAYFSRISSVVGVPPLTLTISGNQLSGSITQAGQNSSGYLASSDWIAFNSKQNALVMGNVTSSDMTVTGGTGSVIGSGVSLTINKGNLTSSDMTITGGTGAVLGSGATLTIIKGNLTESTSQVLVINGGTNAVLGSGTSVRFKQASSTQSGYLSSADYNTFTTKQSALSFGNLTSSDIIVTGGTGAVKGSGTTLTLNKGSLTSSDLIVTGGDGAVLGSGVTLSLLKGNLTETGSSVLTITNPTGAVLGNGTTLQVRQAANAQSGYISAADWNSFNNKVSSQWMSNDDQVYYSNGKVGIGTTDPDNSSSLELKSTTKGFLPPRMTIAQRDAIVGPANGLMIYCLDCAAPNNLQLFYGGSWLPLPFNRSPYATNVSQSDVPFINSVLTGSYIYHDDDNDPEGVSAIKWYRADDTTGLNETAIAGATSSTYTLTSSDVSKYIRFGVTPVSQSGALTGVLVKSTEYVGPISSFSCGSATLSINHSTSGGVAPVNKSTTYGTIANVPGETSKCWITKNLGATQQASSVDDNTEASAGWYWQFNRKQGYKHDGTIITPSWSTAPIDEETNWQAIEDPCSLELGTPWRLPLNSEWSNIDATGGWTNWNGVWGSALKLHSAGNLSSGALMNRGVIGYYYSSVQSSNNMDLGYYLYISAIISSVNADYKTFALSVRCIREN